MDNLRLTFIKYIVFAITATLLNLLTQAACFAVYSGPLDLYVGMSAGTLAGLISKYVLDKHFIFYHTAKNKTHEAKSFLFYSFTGVATTAIFWGTEIAFDLLFSHAAAKYIGAVLGLSIGYTIKYFLDRKYVFNT
ncbi:MAG: GtrA family protein [Gammaproteobacteria bacterium]|nr:GtrA family protein [Gammaproteobacteria bacterium]